jgi:hypothetical protein
LNVCMVTIRSVVTRVSSCCSSEVSTSNN